jgi:HD-like signal output (HDOD) protein
MTSPKETVTSKESEAETPARASESSERQKLVHQMDKLASVVPPLPGIVLRLQQELANEWVNIQKLSNLVRTDPTLAGSVLRVANSPYWRGTRQIVEIEEAIQRMGMETLRSITTVMAMRSAKISDKGPAGSSMRDFWKHSLLVAVGSVQIARRSPVDRQGLEQVWMAGLLHDIGSLLSPMLFPVGWTRVLEEIQRIPAASPAKPEAKDADATEDEEEAVELPPRLDLLDIERLHMETDHGRIGGAFVERHWNLPHRPAGGKLDRAFASDSASAGLGRAAGRRRRAGDGRVLATRVHPIPHPGGSSQGFRCGSRLRCGGVHGVPREEPAPGGGLAHGGLSRVRPGPEGGERLPLHAS